MSAAHRGKPATRWGFVRWTTSPPCWPGGPPSTRSGGTDMPKPVLFVTRRLPASIEALATQDFDARLTPSDVAITDLVARAAGADAMLCCPGDVLDAATIAALPKSIRVIGTFSVGY